MLSNLYLTNVYSYTFAKVIVVEAWDLLIG